MEKFLTDGPQDAKQVLLLGHGAGAPRDSPYMNRITVGLARAGVRVVRFDFPYMEATRRDGRRRPPDPGSTLRQSWLEAIAAHGGGPRVVIGGKSLGGRIASLVADEVGVRGLVCLGYPFHPPGKPERTRTKHLERLRTPTRIIQGTRDPFGTPGDVAGYRLSKSIEMVWIEDGDHSHKPRKSSGRTEEENLEAVVGAVASFVFALPAPAG